MFILTIPTLMIIKTNTNNYTNNNENNINYNPNTYSYVILSCSNDMVLISLSSIKETQL